LKRFHKARVVGAGAFSCGVALLAGAPWHTPLAAQQAGVSAVPATASWPVDPETVPRPVLRATRLSGSIEVDGVLSEAAWFDATPATGFVQSSPDEGSPASERTEAYVLYDDETLYIGAMMYDSEPDRIVAQQMVQDFYSPNEDVFGVSLDTFLDRRNAYYLLVNPNGALRDSQSFDNSRTSNVEWEGVMRVAATIHEEGWSVEMAIPFSTLRFDPSRPEQEWGINFLRRLRRLNEDSMWAPLARRNRVHFMDQAGNKGCPGPCDDGLTENAEGIHTAGK